MNDSLGWQFSLQGPSKSFPLFRFQNFRVTSISGARKTFMCRSCVSDQKYCVSATERGICTRTTNNPSRQMIPPRSAHRCPMLCSARSINSPVCMKTLRGLRGQKGETLTPDWELTIANQRHLLPRLSLFLTGWCSRSFSTPFLPLIFCRYLSVISRGKQRQIEHTVMDPLSCNRRSQLSNLWWIPNSVLIGFGPAMKMGS